MIHFEVYLFHAGGFLSVMNIGSHALPSSFLGFSSHLSFIILLFYQFLCVLRFRYCGFLLYSYLMWADVIISVALQTLVFET